MPVSDALLLTRVSPPRLPLHHIEREALRDRIDKAIDPVAGAPARLTVIRAPAGYGKSTSLAAVAARHPGRFAYLRVDTPENEPVRFWSYLGEALRTVYPGIGERSRALLSNAAISGAFGGPGDSVQAPFLTSLLNEIMAYGEPLLLAIDDYHQIVSDDVHTTLASFIAELPPNARLIIASRSEPPLQLSRLRARGELSEIGAAALAFTREETATYLERRLGGSRGRTVDYERLQHLLEGWPAGLHMAALTAEAGASIDEALGSGVGRNRYVAEFLTDEILAAQPTDVREFLLKTSILRYLSPRICSRLCEREIRGESIDELARRGLFVFREDAAGEWYRYHHLFADLLRSRLEHEIGTEAIRKLHHIAARAFTEEGVPTEALEHALEAGDTEFAAELLERHVIELLNFGRHGQLIGYLDRMPERLIESRPHLAVASALMLTVGGRLERVHELLDCARARTEAVEGGADLISGIIATLEGLSAVFRNDLEATYERSEKALATLPQGAAVWRLVATMVSGDSSFLRGKLDEAYGAYSKVIAAARRDGQPFFFMLTALRLLRLSAYRGRLRRMDSLAREFLEETRHNGFANTAREGQIWGLYSRVAREQLKLDAALERARRACELAEGHGSLLVFGLSRQWLAGAHFARGELEECRAVLDEVEARFAGHEIANVTDLLLAWRLRLELACAERESAFPDRALEIAAGHGFDETSEPNVLHERALFALVRIYRYAGEREKAERLLDRLEAFCESAQLMPAAMEARIIRCLMADDIGDRPAVLTHLSVAVGELVPEGYVYPFTAEGPQLQKLLYALLRSPGAPKETAVVLSAITGGDQPSEGKVHPGAGGRPASDRDKTGRRSPSDTELRPVTTSNESSRSGESQLVEPLSDREVDVLRLISEGLSNRQIAEKLFVSLNTVKWHTANIYGKLGVEGRTGAVARSRELGVLGG